MLLYKLFVSFQENVIARLNSLASATMQNLKGCFYYSGRLGKNGSALIFRDSV